MFRLIVFSLFLLSAGAIQAQKKFTLSGFVKDSETGESLPSANVVVLETKQGASTNTYGFYSLSLIEGSYTVSVSYLGFQEFTQKVNLKADQRININLAPKSIQAKEVEITDTRIGNNLQSTDMGRVEVSVEDMKKLPAFFGEVDLVKIVQLIRV